MTTEPTIPWAAVQDICAGTHRDRSEALHIGNVLRAGGWKVVEAGPVPTDAPGHQPPHTVAVATVYHPATSRSPGELLIGQDVVPPHDPGDPGGVR
jgi:hypothetical protein